LTALELYTMASLVYIPTPFNTKQVYPSHVYMEILFGRDNLNQV